MTKRFTMGSKLIDFFTALSWYLLFGILHEIFHLTSAFFLGLIDLRAVRDYWDSLLFDIMLRRQFTFPYVGSDQGFDWRLFVLHHVGWLSSLFLAVLIHVKAAERKDSAASVSSGKAWCIIAAYLTAIDAIATDLLGIEKIGGAFFPMVASWGKYHDHNWGKYDATTVTLHCGNFGVILLHGAWFDHGGKSALDILKKMIQVTMMRGAQSGKKIIALITCHAYYTTFYNMELSSIHRRSGYLPWQEIKG